MIRNSGNSQNRGARSAWSDYHSSWRSSRFKPVKQQRQDSAARSASAKAVTTAAARPDWNRYVAPNCVFGGYASEESPRIFTIETWLVYLVIYCSVVKPNSFAFSGKRDSWHFPQVGNSTVKKLGFRSHKPLLICKHLTDGSPEKSCRKTHV